VWGPLWLGLCAGWDITIETHRRAANAVEKAIGIRLVEPRGIDVIR